jgi:hypothetical protein
VPSTDRVITLPFGTLAPTGKSCDITVNVLHLFDMAPFIFTFNPEFVSAALASFMDIPVTAGTDVYSSSRFSVYKYMVDTDFNIDISALGI